MTITNLYKELHTATNATNVQAALQQYQNDGNDLSRIPQGVFPAFYLYGFNSIDSMNHFIESVLTVERNETTFTGIILGE